MTMLNSQNRTYWEIRLYLKQSHIQSSNKIIIYQHSRLYSVTQHVIILHAHIQVQVHLYYYLYWPHKIADHSWKETSTTDSEYTLCLVVSACLWETSSCSLLKQHKHHSKNNVHISQLKLCIAKCGVPWSFSKAIIQEHMYVLSNKYIHRLIMLIHAYMINTQGSTYIQAI